MRCKGCCYPLEGLTTHRCPECGRHFDPNFESTYQSKPVNGRFLLLEEAASLALMGIPLGAMAMGASTRLTAIVLVIAGFFAIALHADIARQVISFYRVRHRWAVHVVELRITAAIAAGIALSGVLAVILKICLG